MSRRYLTGALFSDGRQFCLYPENRVYIALCMHCNICNGFHNTAVTPLKLFVAQGHCPCLHVVIEKKFRVTKRQLPYQLHAIIYES